MGQDFHIDNELLQQNQGKKRRKTSRFASIGRGDKASSLKATTPQQTIATGKYLMGI